MKAIIQAYSPEEVERIARGEQTIKVCKTAPKETPFKVYMYKKYSGDKVVGEYVCERVEECVPDYNPITQEFFYNDWEDCSADSLTSEEETAYGKGKPLYGLHISELKIYDKPKELSEFKKVCPMKNSDCAKCEFYSDYSGSCTNWVTRPPQSWQYIEPLDK